MFDIAPIASVAFARHGAELVVTWTTTAPADAWYQVYADRRLAWSGQGTRAVLPWPTGRIDVEVGTVDDTEAGSDLSAGLPALVGTGDRARLSWLGGSYLDAAGDTAGFRVYGSAVAGGPVVGSVVLADLSAYGQGGTLDGFGVGGFGRGGFGRSASSYGWTSGRLGNGTWTFSVRPYDAAGNESAGSTASVAILGPPAPPARNAAGSRLTKSYNAGTRVVTLQWLASPG